MRPILGYGTTILVAALIQSSLLPEMLPQPWRPDLIFLAAAVGAWFSDPVVGAGLGLWGGLLTAVLGDGYVGSFTFSRMLVGFLIGRLREELYGDHAFVLTAVMPLAYLTAQGLFLLLNPRHPVLLQDLLRQAAILGVATPLAWAALRGIAVERDP